MKRNPSLVRLSHDHHHGLVMALRIERTLPAAEDDEVKALYADLLSFWAAGLLPHFRAEQECLLARLVRHTGHADESIERTQRDHLDLESLAVAMKAAATLDERRALLASFGERLKDHIRWEEQVLFERTQKLLTDEEMGALGEELAERIPDVVPS